MPLSYEASQAAGELKQGELLRGVWEHRAQYPAIQPPEEPIDLNSLQHPLVIVTNPACDLLHDFRARFPNQQAREALGPALEDENLPAIVPHLLLCDAYEENQIRGRIPGGDIWRRIGSNQDERYHHLVAAAIGDAGDGLPDLYLDFKRALALPTQSIYDGIRKGGIERVAVLPSLYAVDLAHRLFGFLSRVGLPD